jgi:uncharacterized protein involved in exopolysaccharide biosynthesis
MAQIQSVNEFISVLRRRVFVWAPIVILGLFITLLYTFSLPRIYESSAIIQIGNAQISNKIGRTNSTAASSQYLDKLEQRVMARENLIEIINKHDLYSGDTSLSIVRKVYLLRLATTIGQISDPNQAWNPDASPSALTVTVRMSDRDLVAPIAQDFVDEVLEQNKQNRLEQASRTFSFFEGEETRVGAAISALDAEIAFFKQSYASSLPEAQPSQLSLLVSLEDAALEIEQQIVTLKSGKATSRRTEFEKQLKFLEDQKAQIVARLATVKQSIDAAPQVEKEFTSLSRRLQQLEEQYNVITQNRAEAEIKQMLETGLQSNTLAVLEEPLTPDWPVSPNRKKMILLGGILSVIVAAAISVILELINPVIRNAAQLERQLQLTPVVTIPVIKTARDKVLQRLIMTSSAVVCVIGLWFILKIISQNTS